MIAWHTEHSSHRQCIHSTILMYTVPYSCTQYHTHAHSTILMYTVPHSCTQYHTHVHSTTLMYTVPHSCTQYHTHAHSTILMYISCTEYHTHIHSTVLTHGVLYSHCWDTAFCHLWCSIVVLCWPCFPPVCLAGPPALHVRRRPVVHE